MSHFQEQRKERIQTLQNYVEDETPVEKSKAISEMQIEFGLTESKAEEYLEILEKGDIVEIENEEIKFVD